MALDTFANLKTAINDWLWNRNESSVADFIRLVEVDINRTIRHRKMHKRSTATASGQYLDLPDDIIEIRRVTLQTSPIFELKRVSPDDLSNMRTRYSGSGRPRWYAIIDDTLELLPTPDSNYTVEIVYVSEVPALSDEQTTNWLLDDYPDVYLYGSLVHGSTYLMDPQQLPVFEQKYERAKMQLRADEMTSGGRPRIQIRGFGA